jgi:hypothetical protein
MKRRWKLFRYYGGRTSTQANDSRR